MRRAFGVTIAFLSTAAATDLLRLGDASSGAALPPGWAVRAVRGVALARDILALSQGTFSAAFRKSPLKRTKLAGLRRNAVAVLDNACS